MSSKPRRQTPLTAPAQGHSTHASTDLCKQGYQALSSTPYLRRQLLVAASDHGYCDGAAHQRKDTYRLSPYDTCVFFVQTDKAAARWAVTDQLVEGVPRSKGHTSLFRHPLLFFAASEPLQALYLSFLTAFSFANYNKTPRTPQVYRCLT